MNSMAYYKILLSIFLCSSLFATDDMQKWIRPSSVPQPENNQMNKERIELGKFLFFDVRLSAKDKISCSACHHPKTAWTDLVKVPKAVGFNGRVGDRNSPTILNTAYQRHQFWDGRAKTLEEQALQPIENRVEMNMPLEKLIPKLQKIKGYVKLFDKAYPKEGITKESIAKAIASFERTIVSQEAAFDRYVKGDKNAISKKAQRGFDLFKGKGKCTDCHDGFNFTDGSFHNLGMYSGELKGAQLGRYNVKNRASWYGAMKTPTLRDVAKTAPYFHDGSVKTLEEATVICGNGGRFDNVKNKSAIIVNRYLTREEVGEIVAFLDTLSGNDVPIKIPTQFPQ